MWPPTQTWSTRLQRENL